VTAKKDSTSMNHISLTQSDDGVDPSRVPNRKLNTGALMPAIGLGTNGSDHTPTDEVAKGVKGAALVGSRLFDCASVYENEGRIDRAMREIIKSGVKREGLWINSKLWNRKHGEDSVIAWKSP
jgi:alcohol dehydrogenase (NADP+)